MHPTSNDQLSQLLHYIKVILREMYRYRYVFVLLFAAVSIGILAMGSVAPKTYTSTATLHADSKNIIQPLLSGQAAVTRVEDQVRVVRESIWSPTVINRVIKEANVLRGGESPAEIEKIANELRKAIDINAIGGGLIKVSYSSANPDRTFDIVRTVVDVFISESSDAKRSESRQAYEFINSQVESYKQQLQQAEERLRKFKAQSVDGTEDAVNNRITELRGTVESLKLDIQDVQTRISGVENELGKESQFIARQHKLGVYRESLAKAQKELDTLLLSYTTTHPDVIAVRFKIDDLRRSIREVQNSKIETESNEIQVNPLYEELRKNLAEAKVDLQTKQRRLRSTELLLEQEYQRLKRVAENQAELAELTRDYNVTKTIYEDMLERKEKARLSMTLDIQGRGLNYVINEPPSYPLTPAGLRFIHFVIAGPVLGILLPLGLLVAWIIVDPRIRTPNQLFKIEGIETLAVVGHYSTTIRRRILRLDAVIICLLFAGVICVYGVAIYMKVMG